ncbi:hypothetical protein OROMI_004280 [Orobanche minor]
MLYADERTEIVGTMLYGRSGTEPSLADDCLLFGAVRHLSKTGFYIPTTWHGATATIGLLESVAMRGGRPLLGINRLLALRGTFGRSSSIDSGDDRPLTWSPGNTRLFSTTSLGYTEDARWPIT